MFVLWLAEVKKAAFTNPQYISFKLGLTAKQIFASRCAWKDLRFQFLMSKLYFNFPEKPENASKLYHVEELVNCMKDTFPNERRLISKHCRVNGQIQGTFCSQTHLPLKPIKRGVKIWERCDSHTGYTSIYDFYIYAGKTETMKI